MNREHSVTQVTGEADFETPIVDKKAAHGKRAKKASE
jgi:hypothetical protein